MEKYKWNLGAEFFCGLAVNKFHSDIKKKIPRRFKWKRNADSFLNGSGIKLVKK